MVSEASSVWKINARSRLQWRDWDGLYLLYDAASGDTHLMDEIGAAVFHCLQRQRDGLEASTVLHEVARLLELPPDDNLLDQILEILRRFGRSQLLEQTAA